MFHYEEYETNWWRRFTEAEWENEKKIRAKKGYGLFQTFETDYDLGEIVHLRAHNLSQLLRCRHCGHIWPYGGLAEKETSCPRCKGYVSLKKDRLLKQFNRQTE